MQSNSQMNDTHESFKENIRNRSNYQNYNQPSLWQIDSIAYPQNFGKQVDQSEVSEMDRVKAGNVRASQYNPPNSNGSIMNILTRQGSPAVNSSRGNVSESYCNQNSVRSSKAQLHIDTTGEGNTLKSIKQATFGRVYKSPSSRGEDSLNYSATRSNVQLQKPRETQLYSRKSDFSGVQKEQSYNWEISQYNVPAEYESFFDKAKRQSRDNSLSYGYYSEADYVPWENSETQEELQYLYHQKLGFDHPKDSNSDVTSNSGGSSLPGVGTHYPTLKYQPFSKRFSDRAAYLSNPKRYSQSPSINPSSSSSSAAKPIPKAKIPPSSRQGKGRGFSE
jgi:hypothetical protein